MDELVLRKQQRLKQVFLILSISYHLYLHVTQAAFPIERDVAELTRVSPLKRWIVFMERVIKVCLYDIKIRYTTDFTDILWCMTKKNVVLGIHGQYSGWTTIRMYPNILHSEGYLRLQIFVHHQFNLNVTVIYYFEKYDLHKPGELYLMISGKRCNRLLYPFTFMSSGNSIEFAFPPDIDISLGIEYSIAQRLNLTHYHQMKTNGMYFLWGYFLATFFRIHVDMRAILALNYISCLRCKLIVYDGPTGKQPVIMNNGGTGRYQRIMASTFQVFVVLIEDVHRQEIAITYAPIYINTTVYDLSKKDNVEITFDNRTRCHGHSLSARLCVFVFYTSDSNTIRFSLNYLQFSGKYSGNQYAAGIVFFNHFNGTTEKLVELNSGLGSYKTSEFDIIGTGSKMYVSVFEYMLFASITLRFSMSMTNCIPVLVGDNHISYSGYITPVYGKWNVFQINQSSQALLEHNICYKFQFIHIKRSGYMLEFIFPGIIRMLFMIDYITLHQNVRNKRCSVDMKGPRHQSYWLYSSTFVKKGIVSINSFSVKLCGPLQYTYLQIITLPCTIPCPVLAQGNQCYPGDIEPSVWWGDNVNITCDICKNFYIFCKDVRMSSSILPLIRIKSNICKYAGVQIGTEDPSLLEVTLTFNRNDLLFVISAFTTETNINIGSTLCVVEIPVHTIKLVTPNIHQEITKRVVKTYEWGGALYHSVHQHIKVSWEAAASYCQESEAFLLTIHSRAEYLFVKETFLKTYNIVVLYVGVKRKVR